MDSFIRPNGFPYTSNSNTMTDPEDDNFDFSGVLEIFVHHAKNIHNICIYDNQDVYAKFSLTYNPDETISTRIIHGGGKNPEFNEKMAIKVTQLDGILKCEIWMLSRDRSYMEDQLLGFALAPISQVVGKGEVTENYSLSSTDLFHSPAGTVKLSLSMITNTSSLPVCVGNNLPSSSISSEVVLLSRKVSEFELDLDPIEYSKIEFPDINVACENQQIISEYFDVLNSRPRSFLHLGASTQLVLNDHDTNIPSPPSDTKQTDSGSNACPDTPTPSKIGSLVCKKDSDFSSNESEGNQEEGNANCIKLGSQSLSIPILGGISTESAMQQQIVDMYMKSMQQFTESIAKMRLPMDLDKPENKDHGDLMIQAQGNKPDVEMKKKDGSRIFYGSRAFF